MSSEIESDNDDNSINTKPNKVAIEFINQAEKRLKFISFFNPTKYDDAIELYLVVYLLNYLHDQSHLWKTFFYFIIIIIIIIIIIKYLKYIIKSIYKMIFVVGWMK